MKIHPATKENIKIAAQFLKMGNCVNFPTETVYGIGADATNSQGIIQIFSTKHRPKFNPLIIHIAHIEQAKMLGIFNDTASLLAKTFWPGALTLVIPKIPSTPICDLATAGLSTIALRLPSHPVAQSLLEELGRPIAAPSANVSGTLSPTQPQHISFNHAHLITLDDGQSQLGLESTIISCLDKNPILLRKGSITRQDIETTIGKKIPDILQNHLHKKYLSPGQCPRHYAPKAQLRLNIKTVQPKEALLAFGDTLPPYNGLMRNLSITGNLSEAATNFFTYLHELDQLTQKIAIMPIPNTGLGEAINDRLNRATAKE